MKSISAATLAAATLAMVCMPARATPLFGADDLQRNGAVSRYIWKPDFGTAEVVGLRISAGLALGLRGAMRTNLGRGVTPALTMNMGSRSSVSLLPAGGRGAILVLQTTP